MNGDTEPRRIGDCEVVAKLADGGVGTVYLARRRGPASFQRLVAVKRLHPQFASSPSFVTMFTDEARLAARIHHANVVSIVELGTDDDGTYYVVMEYVEGSNLGHLHWHATKQNGQRPVSRAVALRIVLDALSGLHAAHEVEDDDGTIVNLVHRDVSVPLPAPTVRTSSTSAPPASSRWPAAIAILVLGVVLGIGIGSLVAARLAQRQVVPEATSPAPPP